MDKFFLHSTISEPISLNICTNQPNWFLTSNFITCSVQELFNFLKNKQFITFIHVNVKK